MACFPAILILLALAISSNSLVAQQDYSVGGDWQTQFVYAPVATQPFMEPYIRSAIAVEDLDGDGIDELAFASFAQGGLFLVSGATGNTLWAYSYQLSLGVQASPVNSFATVPDMDGDGVPELLAGDPNFYYGNPSITGVIFLHSGFTGNLIWQGMSNNYGDALGRGGTGLGDVNGDGISDFAVSAGRESNWAWVNAIHIFSGANQSLISSFTNMGGASGPEYGPLDGLGQQIDADSDGIADFLVKVGSFSAEMKSPVTGQTIYTVDDCLLAQSAGPTQVVVIDDLDGDGIPEFVAPLATVDGVACHSGANGAELWRRELLGDAGDALSMINDLDGDGFFDLAVGAPTSKIANSTSTGKIHFLSGASGMRIRRVNSGFLNLSIESGLGISLVYDPDSQLLFTREIQAYGGTLVGPLIALKFEPFLKADVNSISAFAGGSVQFALDFPEDQGGQLYALAVSGVDGAPTIIQDVTIPLSASPLLAASIHNTLPPVFPGGRIGRLDPDGNGAVQMVLPPGVLSSRVGSTLFFAAVVGPTNQEISMSSVAIALEITL
jgi:FG-GAP repeat protein